jgi:hypothetical protein
MVCADDGLCYRHAPSSDGGSSDIDAPPGGPDACPAATDEELCAIGSVECGSLVAIDNCGESRVIDECGPCPETHYCDEPTCTPCTFSWQTGSWSTCSAPCDGGTQTRDVWCECSGTAVADALCPAGSKPAASQACNTDPCCTPSCASHDACGDDGCGVSCGTCSGDRYCYNDFYCVWDHGNNGDASCNEICFWGESVCVGTSSNSCSTTGIGGIDCYCW